MSREALDMALDHVVSESARRVKKIGFTRRGSILKLFSQDNAGILEFQKSTKSSASQILFTINLAVVCGILLDSDDPPLAKARSINAHFRQRIGMVIPEQIDKWWEITEATNVELLSTEISELISIEGAPLIVRYINIIELAALWESGKSPGLTETQRVRYLEKLKSRR